MDLHLRPELLYGAVEFKASKEYCAREPTPPSYVFAIDVSWNSVQWGVLSKAVSAIKELLYENGPNKLPPKVKVGIITFDKAIHFYNLKVISNNSHFFSNFHLCHPFFLFFF